MKPIWIGIVFLLVYGLFSMKTQAAGDGFADVEVRHVSAPAK
jgi:hypothetical protein